MQDKLSAYEVVGIVAPGSVLAFGLYANFWLPQHPGQEQLAGIGELGLIVILSFTAGHLVQAFGNLLELGFWKIFGGWPTNQVLKPDQRILSSGQRNRLAEAVKQDFSVDLNSISETDWWLTVREMDTKLRGSPAFERVQQHNQTYGFMRGLAASFLILSVVTVAAQCEQWLIGLLCLLASALAFYRMHRFGVHYGRALLQAYLNKPSP